MSYLHTVHESRYIYIVTFCPTYIHVKQKYKLWLFVLWLFVRQGKKYRLWLFVLWLFVLWLSVRLPVYQPPYPWYIDPLTHGILTALPMEYQPTYTWYFDLPAYLLIRNGGSKYYGGSIYHTGGGSVFNKGVQYTMDENWPRGQFTMGFKIPYDTGP